MDVLTSETCWALNKVIKKTSGIKLVSLYSTYLFIYTHNGDGTLPNQAEYLNRECSWFHAAVVVLLRCCDRFSSLCSFERKEKRRARTSVRGWRRTAKQPCTFGCRRTAAFTGRKYVLCSKTEGVRKMNTAPNDNCAICNAVVKFFLRLQVYLICNRYLHYPG